MRAPRLRLALPLVALTLLTATPALAGPVDSPPPDPAATDPAAADPAAPGPVVAASESERTLAPGVGYRSLVDPTGPFATHVVTVDPGPGAMLDTALAQGRLEGLETTSSLAARHGALAALNGDFFLPSGRPLHPYAEDGQLLQAPMVGGTGVRTTGRDGRALLGSPRPSMQVRSPVTGRRAPLARINHGWPAPDELALTTPAAGALETAPPAACSARLRTTGKPRRGLTGNTTTYVVEEVSCAEAPMPAHGAAVLSAPRDGALADFVRQLPTGTAVKLSWTFGWPHVTDLLGSHSMPLLEHGEVNPAVDGTDPFHGRHPRTGIGVTGTGQTLLVVVDGRQPGYSVGMTLREFAEHLRRLGSVSAVLLDGGGSSTMVVQGQVVNRPSDGAERPVANALLVAGRTGSWQATPFVATPEQSRSSVEAGRRELVDPGSTGGWAQMARERGAPLPDELARRVPSVRRR